MSVVDALCVGRFCSTLQLASLGPTLAVFNFANYFFFFLNAATTVLITRALACGNELSAINVLSNASLLAIVCGVLLAGVLITCAVPLIAATGCVPALIPTAASYLRVRAIGQPVVLLTMVLQASLLAQQDAVTPLQVVAAACALNVVGDFVWVPRLGAVGAAWATLLAQLVALPLMLAVSRLRNRLPVRLHRPRAREVTQFFTTAAPLFGNEVGFSTCYCLIQSLSTQFSVASAAAFQALWSPLQVLCFTTYPLKQAAQVFLPRIQAESEKLIGGEPRSKEFLKVLASLSSACGVGLATIGVGFALKPSLFTSDVSLWPIITSFAPLVWPPLLLLGFAQVLEGVLLGTGDLSFLSVSQVGNLLTSFAAVGLVKRFGMGVHGTWIVFFAFLCSRAVQAALRVFVLRRPWLVDPECDV